MSLKYLIVGSGYRARFYARIARTYPELFSAVYLCRSEEKARLMLRETGVPAVWTVEEAEAFRPDFIVIAVNKTSITDVCIEWVNRGYHRYPDMIAGLKAVEEGRIGTPGTVYLSLAHDYHGMSLIRRMLMAEGESYTIRGERTMHPVAETDSRTGPIPGNPVREKARDVVWVSFDSGKTALYDFSGVQYHSFIRSRHVIVRGDRGEWCDTILYSLDDEGKPVREELAPVIPDRYRELDSALLRDARALEDAYFRILMEKALAEPWEEIRAEKMPWME